MSLLHVSQMNPETNNGGVAQFARHLKRAAPELKFVYRPKVDWSNAEEMMGFAFRNGQIDAEDTVVADGYYGLGLGGKVKRLIVVSHGTYAGWLRDWAINLPPSYAKALPWFQEAADVQEQAYRQADEIVAVSTGAQEELWNIYGLGSTLIRNGIDVDEFSPDGSDLRRGTIFEVAGLHDENKGCDILGQLRDKEKGNLVIDYQGGHGETARPFRGYEIALMPSRHEGGPYAQLAALAMNKKVVGYNTGFLWGDIPDRYFWGTLDYYWGTFKRLAEDAMESESRNPREWVLQHATLELFCERWRELLDVS